MSEPHDHWTMREEAHYNGGKEFFAYLHRCVQQPRLSRYDRYDRETRAVESTWRVDGVDQPNFESAISAVDRSPIFSAAEVDLLRTISDDPTDRRKEMIASRELWDGLREKGAIVWERGKCHRSEIGRAAISKEEGRS